jgi:hypothetical protein
MAALDLRLILLTADAAYSVVVAVVTMAMAKEDEGVARLLPTIINVKVEELVVVTPGLAATPRFSVKCVSSLGMVQIGAGTDSKKTMFLKKGTLQRP